ncbi:MAG TPA: AGE family epimerase/isomerase [Candidatus Acidoferrum sp.]|nr:AGE family epimerase/isomerase [Candidatus Acidoferrum sp.]
MRAQLADKILPYWFDTAQDTNRGGYLLADDAVRGRRQPMEKQIVTQSRMIWAFSRAHRAGFSDTSRNYLAAATQGYHFLLNHFLDRQNGGYFWSTDLDGKPVNDGKFLYGESFAVYALVEYYRASRDPAALRQAMELYRAVQAHLHDDKSSGWFEHADRNWKLLKPGDPRDPVEIIGCKSANAHLHWMEALTELYDASHDPAVKKSFEEALRLDEKYFYPADPGHSMFYREFDWQPVTGPGKDGLSYGHNVEFAWLMIRADTALGREPSWDRFYALVNHALKYGGDNEHGGLYSKGLDDQPANDTEKVWWIQAEWLAALTDALKHQSDPRYEAALTKLLQFIQAKQADPKTGIWLYAVTAEGQPKDNALANSWKANYHDVRGMLKFVEAFGPEK